MFIPCANARGRFLTADGIVMMDIELAKAFLKEHHVATTSWHHVLNNTTRARPNAHGGKVVHSLTDHKQFEAQGESSATPMIRCTLRLPNIFAAGDGKVLEITGIGQKPRKTPRWMLAAVPWFYFCVPSRRMWCCGLLVGASRPLRF